MISLQDNTGWSPLCYALLSGHTKLAEMIVVRLGGAETSIVRTASIRVSDWKGGAALLDSSVRLFHELCALGNFDHALEGIRFLQRQGFTAWNAASASASGRTGIAIAARGRNFAVVRLLTHEGVRLDRIAAVS